MRQLGQGFQGTESTCVSFPGSLELKKVREEELEPRESWPVGGGRRWGGAGPGPSGSGGALRSELPPPWTFGCTALGISTLCCHLPPGAVVW